MRTIGKPFDKVIRRIIMADRHTPQARRKNMAAVKGKNTKPEMQIRRLLHKNGYRYRLHNNKLPGKPDIVLKKYGVVIFVHGCFWNSHGCYKSKVPETNKKFWADKINKNKSRDENTLNALIKEGLRVLTIWECTLAGKGKLTEEKIFEEIEDFLNSQAKYYKIEV